MSSVGKRLRAYYLLTLRLITMSTGRSYFHLPQPIGSNFVLGQLLGYYNDLSGKVDWNGASDEHGIPLNLAPNGELYPFATTITQKGLAHWEKWLSSRRQSEEHYDQFLNVCRWLRDNQDERGGFRIKFLEAPPYTTPYSSMAQGEAASVLARAYSITSDQTYLEAAKRALMLMLTPMSEGGMVRRESGGIVLEEFPADPPNTVFNGWIFSLFGLYDYLLVRDDAVFQNALAETVTTLVSYLPRLDAGYWSYYDTNRNLTSPFYHQLHTAQLRALELAFPDQQHAFEAQRKRFESQYNSRVNRTRAVLVKTWQKFIHPPAFVNR